MRNKDSRLAVQKTYKLFIGGKFVRGENGRVLPARDSNGEILANYCRASRKDFRDAVKAARAAVAEWSKQSAYLRGQILYRAAEMLEMRRGELKDELMRGQRPARQNRAERNRAHDRSARPLRGLDGQIQSGVRRGESGCELTFQFHNPGTDRRGRRCLSGRTFAARVSFRWLRR